MTDVGGAESSGRAGADFDGLSKEALPQDLPVEQVTRAEDAMRAAAGRSQGLGASDVPGNKRGLIWRGRTG